jgi:hypothetical protein
MDMIQATGSGGVPAAEPAISGVTIIGNPYIADKDYMSQIHGWLMSILIIILAPLLILHIISGLMFVLGIMRWRPRAFQIT